jgi:hypothetical protein
MTLEESWLLIRLQRGAAEFGLVVGLNMGKRISDYLGRKRGGLIGFIDYRILLSSMGGFL